MQGKRLVVRFFKTDRGNEPVREWLKQLDASERKIICVDIKTVEFGWPMGMPTCRLVRNGVYEVRSSLPSSRIARVLFCIDGEEMILLHGFIKKTQKTPQQDIELALKRKQQLEARP